jgi:hypothetical protein
VIEKMELRIQAVKKGNVIHRPPIIFLIVLNEVLRRFLEGRRRGILWKFGLASKVELATLNLQKKILKFQILCKF